MTAVARPGWLPAIDTGRCTGCGWCVAACADLHLLSLETVRWDKRAVLHDADTCTGCSLCAVRCPVHAIAMRKAAATMPATTDSTAPAMSDTERPPLPDRLCTDPKSPHYVEAVLQHAIVVKFNGKARHDVDEYCVSEGWIKVAAGKTVDRKGRPLLIKLKGLVEPVYG